MTLSVGQVSWHLDRSNGRGKLLDHINAGTYHVEDVNSVMDAEGIERIRQVLPNATKSFTLTALCYTRMINEVQSRRLQSVTSCQIVNGYMDVLHNKMLDDSFDVTGLDRSNGQLDVFKKILRNTRCKRHAGKGDYEGLVSKAPEGATRYVFLFSFVYPWLLFLDKYSGHVQHSHEDEVIAWLVSNVQGGQLMGVDILVRLSTEEAELTIRNVLNGGRLSLFRHLEKMQEGAVYSKSPRWQFNLSNTMDADCLVDFLGKVGRLIREGGDGAVQYITSRAERDQAPSSLFPAKLRKGITMGTVLGNFALHLMAGFGRISAEYIFFAGLEKGKNGFYQFVDNITNHSLSVPDLRGRCKSAIVRLNGLGVPSSWSLLDQVGGCAHRMLGDGSDPNRPDQRKPDWFFWHSTNLAHMPMRAHRGKMGDEIQFFIADRYYPLSDFKEFPLPGSGDQDFVQVVWKERSPKGIGLHEFRINEADII